MPEDVYFVCSECGITHIGFKGERPVVPAQKCKDGKSTCRWRRLDNRKKEDSNIETL